jgi:mitochondrial fission protein ELM1
VHIFEPEGGHRKMTAYIDHLVAAGAARRWTGTIEQWSYKPIDATPVIAAEIARRYLAWRDVRKGQSGQPVHPLPSP